MVVRPPSALAAAMSSAEAPLPAPALPPGAAEPAPGVVEQAANRIADAASRPAQRARVRFVDKGLSSDSIDAGSKTFTPVGLALLGPRRYPDLTPLRRLDRCPCIPPR